VMHDTTLEELCRKQPKSVQELMSVSGFGTKKSQTYGLKIIESLNKFRAGARAAARMEKMSPPAGGRKNPRPPTGFGYDSGRGLDRARKAGV